MEEFKFRHAYYLDFQNRRPDYISTFMEKLVSWDAVSSRLEAAQTLVAEREKEEERIKTDYEDEQALEARKMYSSDGDESEAD
ncbi:pentatricopeptide repeat-containing protein at1g02060 chloroplastic [Phtheirospermum japonicum]|uniref:Pentatricopeptide repeat-containing protein at1g02060 chloroplastic n=1 Tax=Phtheirospermum japonicum TaxID=374723 RepID=A0A830BWS2_9LAMI|nr:pentatricopeptide repeat-containing protein at1g02060 chloroplastic [Phtheirospermum japonicum]